MALLSLTINTTRALSPGTRSIQENLYASLPRSLKSEILVKSCVEDPSVQLQNMELTQSKSVSELSQIKSIAEFPIPDKIERLISRSATNTKLTDTSEQQRSVLIRRIKHLEQRVGDLETRLSRLESGCEGKSVRFRSRD